MIFDKLLMLADGLAHDGAPTELDLGNPGQGKGEPVEIYFQGHALTGAGDLSIALLSSATAGSGAADPQTHVVTPAQANEGLSLYLAADGVTAPLQYLSITLTGSSGGTYTAGMVLRGGHHNP